MYLIFKLDALMVKEISSTKLRKELIGHDPSKRKAIDKDKTSGCDPSKGNVTHKRPLYFGGTQPRSFPI